MRRGAIYYYGLMLPAALVVLVMTGFVLSHLSTCESGRKTSCLPLSLLSFAAETKAANQLSTEAKPAKPRPATKVLRAAAPRRGNAPSAREVSPTYAPQRQFSAKSMVYPNTAGTGQAPNTNPATKELLKRLGYSESSLWRAGIKLIPHQGLIKKNCSTVSGSYVNGLAIKAGSDFPKCPNGQQTIPDKYQHANKCTVVYNWQNYRLAPTATGNAQAILAHELGHCFMLIYGIVSNFEPAYISQVRPQLVGRDFTTRFEVQADDFMICRHRSDTAWGTNSYYHSFSFGRPTKDQCSAANKLFNRFFPL
ncbi:MAG TPA: hypothetical protein VGA08_01660 [Candidatus Saccharimonadales bacterium]